MWEFMKIIRLAISIIVTLIILVILVAIDSFTSKSKMEV